jgi:hypothetical protein
MIHRYILKTKNGGSARFNAIIDRTSRGGAKYAVTTEFDVVEIVDDKIPKNLITIDFDKSTRTSYEISFDDTLTTHGIDKKRKDAISAIAECRFVQPSYMANPFIGSEAIFSLEYINGQSISKIVRDNKVVKAYNKWMEMSIDEKALCSYYFGTNPSMNESDLTYFMVGIPQTENGKILRAEGKLLSLSAWENNKSVLDFFLEDYSADSHQQIKSLFKSAIMHKDKIIVKRGVEWVLDKKDGTVELLGIHEDEAVNFLKNNAPVSSFIKEKIGFNCPIIHDLDGDLEKMTKGEKGHTESKIELMALAEQAAIPYFKTMGVNRLKKELRERGIVLKDQS